MAVTDAWSSVDLDSVADGGLIREDVMDEIFDISRIPLPYTDLVGSDTVDNKHYEWTTDKLSDPDLTNAVEETYEPDTNDSKGGTRLSCYSQISTKTVQVTHRADASDTIGRAKELAYQIMMRQRELRRDVEAIALSNQASAAPATEDDASYTAGLGAMITQGSRVGTGGGYTSGGVWTAFTPGTKRALTETLVRDVAQGVWEEGGDPSVIMSVPAVIRKLSEYMFTDSARIATLTAETRQQGPAKAMGSVNVFLTDFGVELSMIPNRLQQPYDSDAGTADAASMFFLDPAFVRLTYLEGYRTDPLAKMGLANTRLMSVDWGNKLLNPEAHGIITDIDIAAAVTL